MTREQSDSTPREDEARDNVSRQIKYLYLVIVIFAIVIGVPVTSLAENSLHNCQRQNSALDYFNRNAQTSIVLTPQEKADRDRHYADLKGHCAGIWSAFQP